MRVADQSGYFASTEAGSSLSSINDSLGKNATVDENKDNLSLEVQIAITGILALVIITGNSLVLVVIRRTPRLHNTLVYFIANLAVADILVGLTMPLHTAMVLYPPMLESIHVCILRYTTICFTESLSLGCLLAMTVDRFVKIVYSLHYPIIMTRKFYYPMIAAVWLIALCLGFLLPTFWYNDWEDMPEKACEFVYAFKTEMIFVVMGYFVIVSGGIVILYVIIIFSVSKHARQLKGLRRSIHSKAKHSDMTVCMTKTCLLVIAIFFLCWLPFEVILAVQIFGDLLKNWTLSNIRTIATFLAIFNSAINPFIYAVRLPDWRRSLWKICGFKGQDNSSFEMRMT